jgi:hypothetical protein
MLAAVTSVSAIPAVTLGSTTDMNNTVLSKNYIYASITATDTGGLANITLYLYRNGTLVSNPDNTILGVGYYLYLANMTGGQNWTDKAVCGTSGFTVNSNSTSPMTDDVYWITIPYNNP